MSPAPRSARVSAVLLAAVAVPALVAGCGASAGTGAAAASGTLSPAGSSSSEPGSSSLAKGLLPAAAFGAQSTVVGLDLEQLAQKAGGGMTAALSGVTITPPECATALQAVLPSVMGVQDAAAQTATGQGTTTVEALVSGGPAATGVATLKQLLAACGSAQATSPKLGQASVTVAEVPVGTLGDAAEAVRVTATATPTDHPAMTVPALAGVVQDGNRLLLLGTVGTDGTAPDEAAFTALLQKAVSTEHAALD